MVKKLKNAQYDYVCRMGGYGCIREADETYNGLNLAIIREFKRMYPGAVMGSYYSSSDTVFTPVPDENVPLYNFCCDFVVPAEDEQMTNAIKAVRAGSGHALCQIYDDVEKAGGEFFIWY